jgi:adenylate cyclase
VSGRFGGPRPRVLIALAVLASALALVAYATDALEQPELDTIDARFTIRGAEDAPPEVAVVAIDDVTFDELDLQWPFPRSVHGRMIDRLRRAGARAIAYDVQFTEPTTPREDNALIEAVARADRIALGTSEVDKRGRSNVFGGQDVLEQIGARSGHTQLDDGDVQRELPHSTAGLETLPVVAAELAMRREVRSAEFPGEEEAWIAYAGPPQTVDTHSFSRVLRGQVPAEDLRGRVVVVGASAPTLQDIHATPTTGDELMSGPEVQANAVATVLDGFPLESSPRGLDVLLVVLLGALAPAAALRLRPLLSLGLAVAAGALYAVATYLAFEAGWIAPVVYPLLALVLGIAGALAAHYLHAATERRRVHDLFARFVPEQVVDEVVARTDGDLRLGGRRGRGTVLFSDLRGFTSFAESMEPDDVIDVLNRYLTEMSDAIMGHGGTLVAYMGDGIMAVFGAPLEQEDHADRALAAAREMLDERLPRFNEWLRSSGIGDGFRMGIGLNSGEFMAGNVGSERRLEFTAIGDTTNTAARLEAMTKGTPHQLFVADSTRSMLKHTDTDTDPDLVLVDELEVRGRRGALKVWAPAA